VQPKVVEHETKGGDLLLEVGSQFLGQPVHALFLFGKTDFQYFVTTHDHAYTECLEKARDGAGLREANSTSTSIPMSSITAVCRYVGWNRLDITYLDDGKKTKTNEIGAMLGPETYDLIFQKLQQRLPAEYSELSESRATLWEAIALPFWALVFTGMVSAALLALAIGVHMGGEVDRPMTMRQQGLVNAVTALGPLGTGAIVLLLNLPGLIWLLKRGTSRATKRVLRIEQSAARKDG
jgi:hypothetical protein